MTAVSAGVWNDKAKPWLCGSDYLLHNPVIREKGGTAAWGWVERSASRAHFPAATGSWGTGSCHSRTHWSPSHRLLGLAGLTRGLTQEQVGWFALLLPIALIKLDLLGVPLQAVLQPEDIFDLFLIIIIHRLYCLFFHLSHLFHFFFLLLIFSVLPASQCACSKLQPCWSAHTILHADLIYQSQHCQPSLGFLCLSLSCCCCVSW